MSKLEQNLQNQEQNHKISIKLIFRSEAPLQETMSVCLSVGQFVGYPSKSNLGTES